jgi:ABC-type uncharacterized transport system permease subunit
MILPSGPVQTLGVAPLVLALVAVLAYAVAAWPTRTPSRLPAPALVAGWLLHAVLLALDIGGWGRGEPGARLGFGPVLSLTVWLVLAVHEIESRFVPLPGVRRVLAINGAAVVLVAWAFPGEVRAATNVWAPVHWLLGVGSYALFGAAVLHAWMLDSAERQLRLRKAGGSGAFGLQPAGGAGLPPGPMGMPLLRLERLTFRFVEAGFVVLTLALVLGVATAPQWRWDHKTVFSLMGWTVFAGLLMGRQWRGWRGRRATRWLYAGAVLLLLAYVGSRFVFEVLVGRVGL